MATTEELNVKISAKFDELQNGLNKAEKEINDLGKTTTEAFNKIDGAVKNTEEDLLSAVDAMIAGLGNTGKAAEQTRSHFKTMATETDAALNNIAESLSQVASSLDQLKGKTKDVADTNKKAMNDQKEQASLMASVLDSWVMKMVVIAGAWKAIDFFGNQIQAGIKFNSTLEESQLGIASLITAQANLKDATGKTLQGQEALFAAQGMAVDQMNQLRIAGLQTSATTQQLAQAFQQAVGAGLQAGLSLDQIRQLTIQITQAAGALGVPMYQLNQEVVSIVNGTIDMNSRVAKSLGISNELVKTWKDQGILAAELSKRFEAFSIAGEETAKQWDAVKSNLEEARDTVSGMATAGLMEELKKGMQDVIAAIIETDGKTVKLNADMETFAKAVGQALTAAGAVAADAMRRVVQLMKEFGAWTERHREGLTILSQLWSGIVGIVKEFVSVISSVISGVTGFIASSETLTAAWRAVALIFADIADRIHYIVENTKGLASFAAVMTGYGPEMTHEHREAVLAQEKTTGRNPYATQMSAAEEKYNLPAGMLSAVARQESGFNPNARSPVGAQGLMQFMPGTAKQYGLSNPFDPGSSIDASARLFRDLLQQFKGDIPKALAGYNAGPGAVNRATIGGVFHPEKLPAETQGYIKAIMPNIPGAGTGAGATASTAAGGLTMTPKTSTAPDTGLIEAKTRAEIQQIQLVTDAEQREVAERTAIVESYFQNGKISAGKYQDEIAGLDKEATAIAVSGIEKQINVYQKKLAAEKQGSKEYLGIQSQIATLENQAAQIKSTGSIKQIKDQAAAEQNKRAEAEQSRKTEIQTIQDEAAADQRAIQTRRAQIEAYYQAGQINAQTYYAAVADMDRAQSAIEIAALNKQIELIKRKQATETAGSREYLQTQAELVAVTNKIAAAQDHAAVVAIKANQQATAAAIRSAHEQLTAYQHMIQENLSEQQQANSIMYEMGELTYSAMLDNQRNFQRSKHANEMIALRQTMANFNQESQEYKKLKAQEEAAERVHIARMKAIDAAEFQQKKQGYQNFFQVITGGFANTIQGMLQGTTSFKDGMLNMLDNVVSFFLQSCATMLAEWAATQLAQMVLHKETTKSTVMDDASKAAAATYASVSEIPYVGWLLAPAAAAVAFAGTMAFAEKGFDIPAGVNPITQLHQREMVLPAKHADVIRNLANNPGSGGSTSNSMNAPVTVNISAVDAQSVKKLFQQHGSTLVDVMGKEHRKFNRVPA